jgi:hypothetical protein
MPEKYFWRSGWEKCFSLDLPSPETYSAKISESSNLALASVNWKPSWAAFFRKNWSCPLFVVLCPFVDISLTVLQHPIDESGEPMGHRSDGLRGSQFGTQTTVLGAPR